MSNKYSTNFAGCTIEEVPNFERWIMFKQSQNSHYYEYVLGKTNLDSILKEYRRINDFDEKFELCDKYQIDKFVINTIVRLTSPIAESRTRDFFRKILKYLKDECQKETVANKPIVNQDVLNFIVERNCVIYILCHTLHKEKNIERYRTQLNDYLAWLVRFDAKYVHCDETYEFVEDYKYEYQVDLAEYLDKLLDKDEDYYEEPENKFNLSNIDLRTIVCYEHWLLYQCSLDDTYLKKLLGESNYVNLEARHSYAKGIFDLCELIIVDLERLAKYSADSGTRIFSKGMLEHIQCEFRKWRFGDEFGAAAYKPDDKLYLSIDRYLEEKEDLELLYKNRYSYNIASLKQSLNNPCCAICTKSIFDGKSIF
jgi:hypothetical protein